MRISKLEFSVFCCIFFFQAEDGIRDRLVTGVQTCALPIYTAKALEEAPATDISGLSTFDNTVDLVITDAASRTASQADVSLLGTRANQTVINEGVKKS